MCMKKFALILSIIICLFLFTGCASSNVLVKENHDGSVDIYYMVNLKVESLLESNDITQSDVNDMKAKIESKSAEIIAKCRATYNFNLNKYYSIGIISAQQKANLVGKMNVYTGWEGYAYVVKFNFANNDAYKIYTNYADSAKTEPIKTEGFFVTKYSTIAVNPLGTPTEILGGKCIFEYFNNLKDNYLNAHFSADVVEKFPKLTMTYSFISTSARVHSDADEKVLTTAGYLHTWGIDESNYSREIEIYSLSANPAVWYLIAITLTMWFVAIYLIVIYFKKPKTKINNLSFDI